MSLLSAGALGVYRDLTARSQRVVVSSAVARSGAVGTRRAGTATGLIRRAAVRVAPGAVGPASAPTTTAPASAGVAAPGVATSGAATSGDEEADGGSAASFGQLLVGQIPSEALLAYTTLLALFSGAGDGYVAGRWALYLLSLPACAAVVASAYFVKRGYVFADDDPNANSVTTLVRHLPWFPMAASVASMAVYGLTVPGCALQVSLTGPAFAIAAGCLAVAGGLMMSMLAPWLGRGNAAQPKPATP
jgi:hypothetical protein